MTRTRFRDRWIDDKSEWDWNPWLMGRSEIFERYDALQKDWNKFVGEYNSIAPRRPFGRPLQASDKQREDVLRLRKDGMSLWEISDELTLGLSSVRTIIDKKDGHWRGCSALPQTNSSKPGSAGSRGSAIPYPKAQSS